MTENESEKIEPLPWHVKGIMLAFAPFVLIFATLVFSAIGAFALVMHVIGTMRLRTPMRSRGRLLSRSEARKRLSEIGGTLIIEDPTLGWRTTSAWWTPDDVPAIVPCPMPSGEEYDIAAQTMRCTPWDKWCWDNYTSPETGRALLLRAYHGQSLGKKVQDEFPKVRSVRTWTALVHFPKCSRASPDSETESPAAMR